MRENFRTGREKASGEFNFLKLPCPKFKRGRQTAHVTALVTPRRLRSHVVRNKRGSKTP